MVLTSLTTRVLTAQDAQTWRRLRTEAVRLYPDAFLPTESEVAAEPEAQVTARLNAGTVLGLFHGITLVGMVAFVQSRAVRTLHRAELGGFFVRRDFHGTGAAQVLMEATIALARQRGVWQLEVQAASTNDRARRFYQSFGFREEGRIPNAVLGPDGPVDDVFLVRVLPRTQG